MSLNLRLNLRPRRLLRKLCTWAVQVLIALDQLANALLFFGWADETISARAWRQRQRWQWRVARVLIDGVFACLGQPDHCRLSYISEQLGAQLPRELRP